MSRERTTWNRNEIVKLANSLKKAEDPRAMNQDHLSQQPAADKYEIGGPSEFGEDVAPNNWKAEYSGGEVKRDEIGMPALRSDTFNHPEKTAAQQDEDEDDFLEKKADVCLNLARKMLPKSASEKMVEDQAFAFMHMADSDIVETAARLASQQDEDDKGQQQDKGQQEAKEAGQIPENFKKDDDKKDEDKGQQQAKEGGQIPENFKKDDDKKDEGQQEAKEAGQIPENFKKQDDKDEDKGQQSKEAALNDLRKRACDALQQGNPQLAQQLVQEMAQQQAPAQQQQQLLSQEQAQQQIDQMLAQAQQGQQGMPQQIMATDAELLDRMLAEPTVASSDTSMMTAAPGPTMDIQLEGPSMDMSEVRLGSEDEALTALFASHDEVQQAAHAHSLQNGMPIQASAPMTRTASTRTVGTRPSGGVSQLGGASAPSAGGGEIDKLAGLWASAPDVKNVFST